MAYLGKYDSPADLLRDTSLSRDEKIEMLQSWSNDKEAFMRATGEGMQGDDRSDLLQLIEDALSSLQHDSPG